MINHPFWGTPMTMETPRQPHNRRSRKAGKSTSRPPFAVVRSTPSRRIPRLSARRKRWIYLVLGSIIAQMNRKDPKHHLASVHPSTTWVDVRLSCSTAATVRRRRWRAGLRQNEGNVRDLRSAPPRAVYPRTLLNPDAPCLEYYIFPKTTNILGLNIPCMEHMGNLNLGLRNPWLSMREVPVLVAVICHYFGGNLF